MDFVSAFLGVIAIIGIITIGGFVVFFLVDLALSVLDPNYVRFGQGRKVKQAEVKEDKEIKTKEIEFNPIQSQDLLELNNSEQEIVETKNLIEDVVNENTEKDFESVAENEGLVDLRAEEEMFREKMLKEIEERKSKKFEIEDEEEIDFEKFFFGNEEFDFLDEAGKKDTVENLKPEEILDDSEGINSEKDFEKEELTEDMAAEAIEDMTAEASEDKSAEASEDMTAETEENLEKEKVELDTKKEVEEEQIVDNLEDFKDFKQLKEKYEVEIKKLEAENFEIKQNFENLEKEKIETDEEVLKLREEKQTYKNLDSKENKFLGNLEEYEEQLTKLKERLSENEKSFRKVKKEFVPLRRVNKTLERDEKKLRRREAIVARKKVELYGVNNVVDIDQEKAQKLTQDLDLLEGLKLSVKHCQEVMNANKERYPLLEQTYEILFNENKNLKEDIEEVENKIKALQ